MGRLLAASLRRRFRQVALILLAVTFAAGTWAALASFAARSRTQFAADLRSFGPNLVVRPQVGGTGWIADAAVERVRALPGVVRAAGLAELAAQVELVQAGGLPAARVRGFDPAAADTVVASTAELLQLHPTWRLAGRWPKSGEVAAGEAWGKGAAVAGGPGALPIVGRVRTGDRLEGAVFITLDDLRRLGGHGLTAIEVRAEATRLAEVAQAIEATVDGAEARPLTRIREADARLGRRVELLLLAIGGVTVLLALLSVAASTAALLGERRTEMGLFLALGYSDRKLALVLGSELLTVTVFAAALGEVIGELLAAGLARRVLGATGGVSFTWGGALGSLLAGLLVVSAALLLVVRRVTQLDAAAILRGE